MYGAYVIRATFVRHATFQQALCKKLLSRICFFIDFFFQIHRAMVVILVLRNLRVQKTASATSGAARPFLNRNFSPADQIHLFPAHPPINNQLPKPATARTGESGESPCNPRRKRKLISDLLEPELNMTRGAGSLTRLDRSLLQILKKKT